MPVKSSLSLKRVGIMLQDKDGVIVSCNDEAEDILGLKRQAMLYLTSNDPRWAATDSEGRYLPGKSHPSMRTLKTGKPLEGFIMSVSKGFGIKPVWLKVDSQPIFSSKGKGSFINGVITLFSEIDPPKKTVAAKNITASRLKPEDLREASDTFIKKAKKDTQAIQRLSIHLSTYLMNLHTQESLSFSPTGKAGALGYETFLMLMQLYSINPNRPIPMKHILHGGHFSARRIHDFLKTLENEDYIEVVQMRRGEHLSRERYIEVTAKLRRIFIQVTLDIQRLMETSAGG